MIATSACPECGTGLVASDRFCGRCGVGIVRCGHCGGAGLEGDRFCALCGRDLSQHITDPTTDTGGQPLTATRSTASPWDGILRRLREATDGEYEVIREIGRGGMAAVFLAHEVALNRRVAIKVMSPGVMLSDGMVDRFHQEAVTVANLTHANIVTVHAVRHVEDLHFFVMEFINGRPLDRVLATRGALSLAASRAILGQVGSALAYAHRRGVIHRDVKPGNIILDADGQAIVTDFGIAKVLTSPSTTQTGAVHGTAAYMSPEQCYAQALTPSSDQYSLGIVAYEMIAGRTPFVAENSFALMQAHTVAAVPSLATLRRNCPSDLDAAVVRMLAKKPTDRWPSMSAALSALQAFPVVTGDPVVDELIDLADAEGTRSVGEVLRTPPGPIVPVGKRTPPRATPPAPTVRHMRGDGEVPVAAPPRTIHVEPAHLSMEVGESSPARAIVRGGLPVSALENVVWTSSAPHCALVDGNGVITAAGAGTATITAAVGEATSTMVLTVTPARVASLRIQPLDSTPVVGATVRMVANAADKSGRPLSRTIQWSAHPADVGTISGSGNLTLHAPGTITIRATCDTIRDEIDVVVRARPVARLDLGDVPPTVATDSTLSLVAIARDDEGGRLDGRAVTWVSSDPAVATVSDSGVVLAHRPGSVTLTAKCESKAASVRLTVAPPPLAAIDLTPLDDDLYPAERTRVRAVVRDVTGAVVNAKVAWTTSNARVVAVSETGQIEALQPGDAVISARVGALSASLVVRVAAPLPVAIDPGPSISLGTVEEVEAVAIGAPPSDAPSYTEAATAPISRRRGVPVWAWGGGGVAALAAAVLLLSDSTPGPDNGQPPVDSSITIVPQPTRLVIGDSLRLTAQGSSLGGGRAEVMRWRGSANIHVDSASGLVVARAAGPAVVIASNGEVADTATFDVVLPPGPADGPGKVDTVWKADPVVASVAIERPGNRDTVDVGEVIQLRAVPYDSTRRPMQAKVTRWSSSDPAIADVDARSGAVTARAPGTARITARIDARTAAATYVVRPVPLRAIVIAGRDSVQVDASATYRATVFDARNSVVANATVTWSTDPRNAADIDASGRLRALEAGTLIVRATVGPITTAKRVTVTRKPDTTTVVTGGDTGPVAPRLPTREELFQAGATSIRAAVDECAREIGARNIARVQTLYAPATDQDRRNLSRLSTLMRSHSLTLIRHSMATAKLEGGGAVADFSADLRWLNFVGVDVNRSVGFRATFGLEGSEWRLRSCRIVGNPRLE